MALAATIFRADVTISDIDRNYYRQHVLTIARHPSETDERMMVRLLAFLLHADEQLKFGKGLSENSEPDLWLKDLTGHTRLWIEAGMPDARRLAQASGRADQVVVYAYGRQAQQWWKQTEKAVDRLANLSVCLLPVSLTQALARMAKRSMRMICSIQEGQLYLDCDDEMAHADFLSLRVRQVVS